jgi:glutamate carboxypeptidase
METMDAIDAAFNKRLPAYIDLLRRMVSINSFTANAAGVNQLAELTASAYGPLGFRPEFVQSVNPVFGRHLFLYGPGWNADDRRPAILMVSHLDTVFPAEEEQANAFFWRVEGERAFGPGAVDIKGGTVLCLALLETLKISRPDIFDAIRWLVALDASEETLSEDFGNLCIERLPKEARACLVFEGGTPNSKGFPLVTARKGRAEFLVTAQGRGAHAGNYHKQGANAIIELAHAVQHIAAITDYANALTVNVGVIHGGSVVNRVPHSAEAIVEMRAFDPAIFEAGMQKILALDGNSYTASQDGYPCRISVQVRSQTPPWPRNPDTERLFQLWSETAQALGMHTLPEQRGGLSDGNLIWKTVPTLDGLGPTGNNAHCSERSADGSKEPEYVLLSSFAPKVRLNLGAIMRLYSSFSG